MLPGWRAHHRLGQRARPVVAAPDPPPVAGGAAGLGAELALSTLPRPRAQPFPDGTPVIRSAAAFRGRLLVAVDTTIRRRRSPAMAVLRPRSADPLVELGPSQPTRSPRAQPAPRSPPPPRARPAREDGQHACASPSVRKSGTLGGGRSRARQRSPVSRASALTSQRARAVVDDRAGGRGVARASRA